MTDKRFESLINNLQNLVPATNNYTLTGATDWPILAVMAVAIVGLLVYIWQDLKGTIKEHRAEWKDDLEKEIAERKEQDEFIWTELRERKRICHGSTNGN